MRRPLLLLAVALGAGAVTAPTALAAPPPAPGSPDLAAASDSGARSDDDITKVATPTFTVKAGSGTELGSKITLCKQDGSGTTAEADFGVWSGADLTFSSKTPLTDGTYKFFATAHNAPSNPDPASQPSPAPAFNACIAGDTVSALSTAIIVKIDTTGPKLEKPPVLVDATQAHPDLTFSSKPFLYLAGASVDDVVTIAEGATDVGTTTIAALPAYVKVTTALAEGPHTLSVRATDLAGNQDSSPSVTFTVDTSAPTTATPDLIDVDDDGASPSDNYTRNPRPRFTVTAESGARVTLFENGMELGSAVSTAGVAMISLGEAVWLDPGQHCVYAIAWDLVGNPSAESPPLCATIAPGMAPFTSNLGVGLTGDFMLLSLRPSIAAHATIRVYSSARLLATKRRALDAGLRTKLRVHLPSRVRKARLLRVVATLHSEDGRTLVVRRAVRHRPS
jgi:large repetitive protein